MNSTLSQPALQQIFSEARSHGHWLDRPVELQTLQELYETAKWGPTSMNAQPARYLFLLSPESRERLIPALMEGNIEKTKSAPVTVIVAGDSQFYDYLPEQFPAMDVRQMFSSNAALSEETGFRNSSLQAGYFILAARALGLDCGPMSGFDGEKINQEFFPDGRFRVNMLINLGYADRTKVYPRGPRLSFEQACRIL